MQKSLYVYLYFIHTQDYITCSHMLLSVNLLSSVKKSTMERFFYMCTYTQGILLKCISRMLDQRSLVRRHILHRSQTLLWYTQCNGGYDQFVTAETISFNGVFTLTRKTERIDGMKMSISFCVYIVFK